jgi:PAS domain-containing protein
MSTDLKPYPAIEAMDVRTALQRLLEWPNPNGTIEQAYVPMWLAASCRAALAAAPAGGAEPVAVPEGWKLVPLGATHEMLKALTQEWHPSRHESFKERYRAMLDAAPTAQPQPQPERMVAGLGRITFEDEAHELLLGFKDDESMRAYAATLGLTVDVDDMPQPEAPAEPSDKPLGYVKFRAAQTLQTDGYCDGHEWLEFCEPGELGDDKKPAFAVYATPQAAPVAPAEQDITRILLDVVPGEDGMGHEVYATCVKDVEAVLTRLGDRVEELAARPVAPAAQQPAELTDAPAEKILVAALNQIIETANCRHWAGMNEGRRSYAMARDAQIALDRVAAIKAQGGSQ